MLAPWICFSLLSTSAALPLFQSHTAFAVVARSSRRKQETRPFLRARLPLSKTSRTRRSYGDTLSGWRLRLPKLSALADKGREFAWTALGTKYWMEFQNWEDHHKGPSAYDNTHDSLSWNSDGQYMKHIYEEYQHWSQATSWSHLWNAASLSRLNAHQRGSNCTSEDCDGMFSLNHVCFHKAYAAHCANLAANIHGETLCGYPGWRVNTTDGKRRCLGHLFEEYFSSLKTLPSMDVEHAFPSLVRLFTSLALLHPFKDSNSRARLFVLQTELVRLGGHPVLLKENHVSVYRTNNLDEVEDFILEGWCAWEWALQTGKSPSSANVLARHTFHDGFSCRNRVSAVHHEVDALSLLQVTAEL